MTNRKRVEHLVLITLGILWFIFVVGNYFLHHPDVGRALDHWPFWDVLLLDLVLCGFGFWVMNRFKKIKSSNNLRLYPWLLWLVFIIVVNFLYLRILEYTVPQNTPIEEFSRHFLTHSLKYLGLLIVISLSAASWGHFILRLLFPGLRKSSQVFVHMALGFSLLGTLSLLQGLLFNLSQVFHWIIILIPLALGFRYCIQTLGSWFIKPIEIKNVSPYSILTTGIIMIFLALSWIMAQKLYPTGYDGITYYGHLAKLIGEGKEIISGYQPYHWSLLMSWGWLLLDDPGLGFLLCYLPGWLGIGAMIKLSRRFLDINQSLAVAMIWISSPFVFYQYGQTEKIDLALNFILISSLLFYFQSISSKGLKKLKGHKIGKYQISAISLGWLAMGWILGYALGIKLTAIFAMFAFALVIFYENGGYKMARWGFLILIGIFFTIGIERFAGSNYGSYLARMSGLILTATGIYEIYKNYGLNSKKMKKIYRSLIPMILGIWLSFGIWPVKNFFQSPELSFQNLLNGPVSTPMLNMASENQKTLNLDDKSKLAGLVFLGSSRREELGKFLGFDEGFFKYFSTIYKLTTNPGMEDRSFVNIGFYMLLCLPLLLFYKVKISDKRFGIAILSLILFLSISVYTTWNQPNITEIRAQNNELIENQRPILEESLKVFPMPLNKGLHFLGSGLDKIPLLGARSWRLLNLFFSILLLLGLRYLCRDFLSNLKKHEKTLIIMAIGLLFIWYLIGEGIPWYAFTGIILVYITIQLYFSKKLKIWQHYNGMALGLTGLILYCFQFNGSAYQNKSPEDADIVLNSSLLYSSGNRTEASEIYQGALPIYHQASEILNTQKDAKIYMVGTLIHYFVDNFNERVLQDNQLEIFNQIHKSEGDVNTRFLQSLKNEGFKYIVFNPSDMFYDQTPEKTFAKKFEEFWMLLASTGRVDIIYTDNEVQNNQGETKQDIRGQTTAYGRIAILEIL
jgi:hypothetical protein